MSKIKNSDPERNIHNQIFIPQSMARDWKDVLNNALLEREEDDETIEDVEDLVESCNLETWVKNALMVRIDMF